MSNECPICGEEIIDDTHNCLAKVTPGILDIKKEYAKIDAEKRAKRAELGRESIKRLVPYQVKPGQVLNPKGRPPKYESLVSMFKLEAEVIDPETGKPNVQAIASKLISLAKKGNIRAAEVSLAYILGKPVEMRRVIGDANEPIVFKVVYG